MTEFDFAVTGILLVSMLFGLWRGLIYEVMALLGWPLAFVLSKWFIGDVTPWLPIERESTRIAVAYPLIFCTVMIVWAVLTRLLIKALRAAGAGWTDRLLGGMFGIVRGGLVVLVLVWLVGLTNYFEQPFWREALVSRTLEDAALQTRNWLPDNIAQRIHYGIRS